MIGMATTAGKGSMFDAQSNSTGAASSVKHYATDGSNDLVVPGTRIKVLPVPEIAKGEYDGSEEYRQFVADRAEWVYLVNKAGGRTIDCWSLLRDAGHNVTVQGLYSQQEAYRRKRGLEPIQKTEAALVTDRERPEPTVDLEEVASAGRAHADTLAGLSALIDAAAERLELELRIEIEDLKPKALKWEQLRKIRDLLPK